MDMEFSVLLSVYKKEKPEYLQVALESIVNQTLMPNEILIVEDGKLTAELDMVIETFKKQHKELVRILAFEQNRGLGSALHDGVLACKYELIARMDTDDIAYPERFEKQLAYIKAHSDVAMVGSWITEFSSDLNHPDTITKLPCTHEKIACYAIRRNPFRHMTVIYKKSVVIDSGNYRDFLWFEDYDLWVRMIQKGYRVANIPEVLVNVRADDEMFARRGGLKYLEMDLRFQKQLKKTGFINTLQYLNNLIIRISARIIPNNLRIVIYKYFLRDSKKAVGVFVDMPYTIAIVTVYYPNDNHVSNIKSIAEQTDRVIICDNSPKNNDELFFGIHNLNYCFWGQNLGLSQGFNRILKDNRFLWNDDDFIIFFDQDTKIPTNHIAYLVNNYFLLKQQGFNVGCIGPFFFNESMQKTEIPILRKRISNSIIEVKSTITSSMLCRYKELKSIGFWNEEIFLDMADWDICWRFKHNNMKCFMTSATIINHTVGEGKKRILGFYDLRIAKPFREYYQTRDCLYLFWKNYIPWNFRMRFLLRLTIRNVLHVLFLDEQSIRLRFIIKGFKDYFNNVHGALDI